MRSFPTPFAGITDTGSANVAALWQCNEASAADNLSDSASLGPFTLVKSSVVKIESSLYLKGSDGARQFFGGSAFAAQASTTSSLRGVFANTIGWTVEGLFRLDSLPVSEAAVWSMAEYEATPTSAGNILAELRITSAGDLIVRRETGSGVDEDATFTIGLSAGVVYYIAVVDEVDPADDTKRRCRLYVAPALYEGLSVDLSPHTVSGIDPATGGSLARFCMAASLRDGSGTSTPGSFCRVTTDAVRILRYPASDAAVRDSYQRFFRPFDETRILNARTGVQRARVLVEDDDFTWIDLTQKYGRDTVQSVDVSFSSEDNSASARVDLRRQFGRLNTSPFMQGSRYNLIDGSYTPMLRSSRRIRVDFAVLPRDWPVQGWEWRTLFEGRIDRVDAAADPVQVNCIGLDAPLIDTFIEQQTGYAGGVTVEAQIAQLIDDNPPTLLSEEEAELYVRDVSGFAIGEYAQSQQQLSEAISTLADQIGYTARFEWDDNRQKWRLTLRNPPRTSTWDGLNEDYDIEADQILGVNEFADDKTTIRNKIMVGYLGQTESVNISAIDDSGTGGRVQITTAAAHGRVAGEKFRVAGTTNYDGTYTVESAGTTTTITTVETKSGSLASESTGQVRGDDIEGNPILQIVTAEDATSQGIYGKMTAQVFLGSADAIDTREEAQSLADGILSDLADPQANYAVTVPFLPYVELHDIVAVRPDAQSLDTALGFAVVGWSHSFRADGVTTAIQLRGKSPSGRGRRWLGVMVGTGVSSSLPTTYTGPAVQGGTVGHGVPRGIAVDWQARRRRRSNSFDMAEVHVSTVGTGFVVDETTIRRIVRGNGGEITGLTPETQHFVKYVPIDKVGNRGAETSALTITPKYSAGAVPFFKAYRATSNQTFAAATETKAQLNAEHADYTSDYDATTNYRYTAKSTGFGYAMSFSALIHLDMGGKPNENGYLVAYRYNSSGTQQERLEGPVGHDPAGDKILHLHFSWSMVLDAGDYVEIYARPSAAASIIVPDDHTFWTGAFISDKP